MRWAYALVLAGCRFGFDPPGAGGGAPGDGALSGDGFSMLPVDAAPGTLLPTLKADTYLDGIDSTPNGANQDLRCGRDSGNGNNQFMLFWFDLSALPAQPVSNATLRIYQFSSLGTMTVSYDLYRVTQTWDEATADWTHASTGVTWPIGGAIALPNYVRRDIAIGTYGYYDWDVTTLVNEWLTGVNPNYGVDIQYTVQPPTGNVAIFASKEHSTAAWRPQLLITP